MAILLNPVSGMMGDNRINIQNKLIVSYKINIKHKTNNTKVAKAKGNTVKSDIEIAIDDITN